jgi:hypothetical protein
MGALSEMGRSSAAPLRALAREVLGERESVELEEGSKKSVVVKVITYDAEAP